MRGRRTLRRLGVLLIVVAVWETIYRLGLMNPIIFAAPSLILSAAVKDGWTFLSAFRVTVFEITMATLIAWSLGIVFGVIAGALPILARHDAGDRRSSRGIGDQAQGRTGEGVEVLRDQRLHERWRVLLHDARTKRRVEHASQAALLSTVLGEDVGLAEGAVNR